MQDAARQREDKVRLWRAPPLQMDLAAVSGVLLALLLSCGAHPRWGEGDGRTQEKNTAEA